jgi:ABC-type glycerol-3-phosphate transport system permease component
LTSSSSAATYSTASVSPSPQLLRRLSRIGLMLPLIVYTIVAAGPLVWTALLSLRSTPDIYRNPYGLPTALHFGQYLAAFRDYGYATFFKNSLIVTGTSLALVTLSASMAAYVLARPRYAFRLREAIFVLIFMSIMIPPQIMVLSLYQLMVKYGLYNTRIGLVLVYAATELPLAVYLLRAFYAQIPQDLEDAALLDGCGDFSLFWRVMFPIARPAVSTVLVLDLIRFWNEYLYASVLLTKSELRTLPLANMLLLGDQYADIGALAAALVVSTLPIIVLYLFLSESFISGMTAGALKG